MSYYLFGYGSLLSPRSVSRTLERIVTIADLPTCTVFGHRRTWTAHVQVYVGPDQRAVDALFLDLSKSLVDTCNGVLLAVSTEELARLDVREKGYERRSVTAVTDNKIITAFAYMVPDAAKTRAGHVLRNYTRLIEDALPLYPAEFIRAFEESTDPPPEPLLAGDYRFSRTLPEA